MPRSEADKTVAAVAKALAGKHPPDVERALIRIATRAVLREDRHLRAVAIFEQRMGFEYTDEYEQSREWSDAWLEADAADSQEVSTV